MKIRLLFAALAAFAITMPAGAQTVAASNPATIVQALQSAGFSAALGRDERGDPKIDTAVGGTNIVVYFFDCDGGRACRAVQFHSSYAMQAPPLETMNRWNRDTRYARAFVTADGNPALEMDVNLDAAGGMSRRLFLDNLELFAALVPDFERLIGWQR